MTAASPHVAVRADWLRTTIEPAIAPDLPIGDAHHHLWDRPGARDLLADLLADLGTGHRVTATVYVQLFAGTACATYRLCEPEVAI